MDIKRTIKEAQTLLGIEKLRKHQVYPIKSILDYQDTMVIAPPSAGKSLIGQIPALIFHGMTLVIEPTLSLMYDQVDKLQLRGIQAASINSAMPAYERSRTLEYIAKGKVKILFVTPERLHNPKFLEAIQDIKISMIAVDERHCVTLWGMVSGLIIWRLEHLLTVSPHKPVIAALTATAASDMRLQICKLLSMDQPKIFVNSLYRPKGSVERLL